MTDDEEMPGRRLDPEGVARTTRRTDATRTLRALMTGADYTSGQGTEFN